MESSNKVGNYYHHYYWYHTLIRKQNYEHFQGSGQVLFLLIPKSLTPYSMSDIYQAINKHLLNEAHLKFIDLNFLFPAKSQKHSAEVSW